MWLGLEVYLVAWILINSPLHQRGSLLCLFWFPQGQGQGRPWHLHTNENNHGKYVNLSDCGWPKQTVLFEKGQMLLWIITYGKWIHLTLTIMALHLTHTCDALNACIRTIDFFYLSLGIRDEITHDFPQSNIFFHLDNVYILTREKYQRSQRLKGHFTNWKWFCSFEQNHNYLFFSMD